MKFSLSVLFAALCSVQYVESVPFSAATIGVDLFHETAGMDQWHVTGTVGVDISATGATSIVLTSVADVKRTFVAGVVQNTDYEVYCGTTKWSTDAITSAAVSGSDLVLTILTAVHADRICAVGGVLKVKMLKATATAGASAKGAFALTTTGQVNDAATATYTATARGTFAAVTDGFKVSSYAATEFANFELKFTTTVTLSVAGKFTVSVPGYKLKATNQCTLEPADSSTAPTVIETAAEDVSPWEFALVGTGFTAQAYTIKCSKVIAPAIQAANTVAVLVGDTTQTVTITGLKPLAAVIAATPAPFSAAPASAGGSMAALVLGSFAALCLLF